MVTTTKVESISLMMCWHKWEIGIRVRTRLRFRAFLGYTHFGVGGTGVLGIKLQAIRSGIRLSLTIFPIVVYCVDENTKALGIINTTVRTSAADVCGRSGGEQWSGRREWNG